MTKDRYHIYVNHEGEVLCVQLILADGSRLEPWRPFHPDNQTVVRVVRLCDEYFRYSIHGERFIGADE